MEWNGDCIGYNVHNMWLLDLKKGLLSDKGTVPVDIDHVLHCEYYIHSSLPSDKFNCISRDFWRNYPVFDICVFLLPDACVLAVCRTVSTSFLVNFSSERIIFAFDVKRDDRFCRKLFSREPFLIFVTP